MDEPCSALDPIATQKIEELIVELKRDYTIVIVTHNMQQAARVRGRDRLLRRGRPGRVRRDRAIFTAPRERADGSLHHREIRMSEAHRHFHDELATSRSRLLTMSGEAEAALGLAVDALLERDNEKAQRVINGDREIDKLEVEIEERSIRLLALQQPMARDLRMLTSAIKIANDLERVGDHAVNIAQSATRVVEVRDPSRRSRKSSRWRGSPDGCSRTPSKPSSAAIRRPAARSASGMTRWMRSIGRSSGSCSRT